MVKIKANYSFDEFAKKCHDENHQPSRILKRRNTVAEQPQNHFEGAARIEKRRKTVTFGSIVLIPDNERAKQVDQLMNVPRHSILFNRNGRINRGRQTFQLNVQNTEENINDSNAPNDIATTENQEEQIQIFNTNGCSASNGESNKTSDQEKNLNVNLPSVENQLNDSITNDTDSRGFNQGYIDNVLNSFRIAVNQKSNSNMDFSSGGNRLNDSSASGSGFNKENEVNALNSVGVSMKNPPPALIPLNKSNQSKPPQSFLFLRNRTLPSSISSNAKDDENSGTLHHDSN